MKHVKILLNILMFLCISIIITTAFYFVNVRLFPDERYFPPTDAFFIEGIIFLIFGFLLLVGSGGINLWSVRAALLSALAGFLYDEDTVGPNEIMRRDKWKPEGFPRLGLILILTGVLMLLAYFINLIM